MKVYLAGPMRNYPNFNFPAFDAAAAKLRAAGHIVFSPAERDREKYGDEICASPTGDLKDVAHLGFSLREAMKTDLDWICDHAEAIALLPGWEKSRGANAEMALASCLRLDVIHLD